MKKLILSFVSLMLLASPTYAWSFKKPVEKPAEIKLVEEFFNEYKNYSGAKNIEEIKKLYDKSYISTDGYNYTSYFELMQKSFEKFPNTNYDLKIKKITVDGDNYVVQISDITTANIKSDPQIPANDGELYSICDYLLTLQNINGKLKIVNEKVIDEFTSLRFGDALTHKVELKAPRVMKAGEQYSAILEVKIPEETFVMGSISNELAVYPPIKSKEVFRKFPQDGILERVLKANESNTNEYVVASIGMTKAKIDGDAIRFVVSGAAFVVKRVDVVPKPVLEDNK